MSLYIYQQDEALVAGSFGGVFFSIWWYLPTAPQIWAVHEMQKRFREDHPGDFALLSVMKMAKVGSLTSDARQAAAETRKFLGPCIAEANIVEAGGIGISIARMLFATINLINRPKYPIKLFTSLQEGVAWLAPFVGVQPKALLNAVQESAEARPQVR
jgi:hypothetical protein